MEPYNYCIKVSYIQMTKLDVYMCIYIYKFIKASKSLKK